MFEQRERDHGLPRVLCSDTAHERTGQMATAWTKANGGAIQYIQPGERRRSAYIEGAHRSLRDAVLDQHRVAEAG